MTALARGLSLGGLPGLVLVAWIVANNPWFLDRPALAMLLLWVAPGLLLGLIWRGSASARWRYAVVALGLSWALLVLRPTPPPDPVRLLVVGWDGATWTRIDPMVAQGQLPAMQGLLAQSGRATLVSMEPMFSPLLWTTMATGKPPAEHGVRGFRTRSSDLRVPRFWDIAEAEGLRIGVYKWLVTYPPRAVQGFMVPDWLAPAPETWPEDLRFIKELELKNRLARKRMDSGRPTWRLAWEGANHGLRFGTLLNAALWKLEEALTHPSPDTRTIRLQLLRGEMDRDVFVHTLHAQQPDLATFGYYATDALGHPFWSELAPGEPGAPETADALPAAYRQADTILAELLTRVPDDCAVVLLSDHGFRAADPSRDPLRVQPLTERLRARLREQGLNVDIARLGWKLTVTVDPMQEAAASAALKNLLDETGQPFFVVESVAAGALGLTLRDERLSEQRLRQGTVGGEPLSEYVQAGAAFAGEHDAAGVFLVRAPGLSAGPLPTMGLLDVAPTLSALMGIPPAQDLTGRVVVGDDRRGPASRDSLILGLEVLDGAQGVDEAALKALGYIEGE